MELWRLLLFRCWRGVIMKPLFMKLGFAVAVSAAGYVASQLRPREPIAPGSPSFYPSGAGLQAGLQGFDDEGAQRAAAAAAAAVSNSNLEDELCLLRNEEALAHIITGTVNSLPISNHCIVEPKDSENETYLLQEPSENFDSTVSIPATYVLEYVETQEKKESMEEEITLLRNMVGILNERERSLELKLLRYHALKDQESVVRELENRVKIHSVESQLLSMRMEKLQADNESLRAQAGNYSKLMIELQEAKAKVHVFKKRLKVENDLANGKIASLRQTVSLLEERRIRNSEEVDKTTRDLEEEIDKLRRKNSQLAQEKSELVKKLDSTGKQGSSTVSVQEAEKSEEANCLREANSQLTMQIEQLQSDRFADLEELVYLRWINACLRYELKDYQHQDGKPLAKDLSVTLNPGSEQQAKQLILQYAHSGVDDKVIDLVDFDSECWSSSSDTSNSDYDDSLFAMNSTTRKCKSGKPKFFSKLKKIVLGKRSKSNRVSASPASNEDSEKRSSAPVSPFTNDKHPRNQNFTRHSMDAAPLVKLDLEEVQRRKEQNRKSDVGTSFIHKVMSSPEDYHEYTQTNRLVEDAYVPDDLKKFAKALENSRNSSSVHHRGAASYNFN